MDNLLVYYIQLLSITCSSVLIMLFMVTIVLFSRTVATKVQSCGPFKVPARSLSSTVTQGLMAK